MALRRLLDKVEPLFLKGGSLEKFYAVYEMIDSVLYTSARPTQHAPHVRDGINLQRAMTYVVWATIPCILMALWNTGYQANNAMSNLGLTALEGWRGSFLSLLGVDFNPNSLWDNIIHGLAYFLPLYIVTLVVGGIWEVLFAAVRGHDVNEGFLVTSMLFTLTLPPSMPLWQVAIGISFGVVIGKEVFGGVGKNFLNPALTGRAFLYFAFPAQMSGDMVWTAVDGFSGATPLGLAALGGISEVTSTGFTWMQSFLGVEQGSIGETSALACLLGAAFLLYTRVASWRIMVGIFLGMMATSLLFNLIGSETNPMFSMTWYWHFVLGGFAFGMIFMATDPVSAAMTEQGRWIFGLLIGAMTVLIRVVNPAYPEGIMLAILFGNLFAPLIDYGVMKANIRRRVRRNAI